MLTDIDMSGTYEMFLLNLSKLLGARLLKELKKLDDKALLVEVQLNESKTYHALNNVPKSRYLNLNIF